MPRQIDPGLKFQTPLTEEQAHMVYKVTIGQELREYFFYFVRVFLTVTVFYLFIRTSVFDLITVSGKSMSPTYNDTTTDDSIYIDQLTPKFSDYQRGDVIVLVAPEECDKDKSLYIKRIIGLPGERVALEGGNVYIINDQHPAPGIILNESDYLDRSVKTFKKATQDDGLRHVEKLLEEDEYYFMGDNRSGSADSRVCGTITKNQILGREFFRLSPGEKRGYFQLPTYNISNLN